MTSCLGFGMRASPGWIRAISTLNYVTPLPYSISRVHRSRPRIPTVRISIPETAPLAPITPYGLGKVQSELAVQYFGRVVGLKHAVLRLGNPIGQWQQSQRQGLVGIVLRCLAENKPLQLFGDGHNLRDYFDADDVAELVLKLDAAREMDDGVWNVGSGMGTGELELLDLIQSLVGRRLDIEPRPARNVDLRYAVLDASKAERDFQWSCTKSLRDSLSEIIARSAMQQT